MADCTQAGVLERAHDEFEAQTEAHIEVVSGNKYMRDSSGSLVPLENIKPQHLLEDQTVRKIFEFAESISAQVQRFRQHTFDDIDTHMSILQDQYGFVPRGLKADGKGNVTMQSFDGCFKIVSQNAERIDFGPELQTAKLLVDQCLNDWSGESNANIRAIVNRAFNVDKPGGINRAELLSLLRLNLEDDRWQNAMQAIRDSIKVVGTKRYARFYKRDTPNGQWQSVVIDVAAS